MISFKQIRNFSATIILAFMLAITVAFDFGTSNTWAATIQPLRETTTINQKKPVVENSKDNIKDKTQDIFH